MTISALSETNHFIYDGRHNLVSVIDQPNGPLSQALIRTPPDGSRTYYDYGAGRL